MAVVTDRFRDALPAPALAALGLTPSLVVFDTVVMGRETHGVGVPHGLLSPYPHLRQIVASRSAPSVGPDVEVTADPVGAVRCDRRRHGRPRPTSGCAGAVCSHRPCATRSTG